MKRLIFLISCLVIGGFSISASATSPIACTMEYAPVCGSVQVQCITTPCNPVKQTFSNSCVATAQGAQDITPGECNSSGSITPPVIVGGDTDKHGCIGSAGYRWNSVIRECVRPWMTKTRVITIGAEMTTCMGMAPYACMQMKQGGKWKPFYESIDGFDYATGSIYRLLIKSEKLENPPADASDTRYSLIRILSTKKQKKASHTGSNWTNSSGMTNTGMNSLSGTSWMIESMSGVLIRGKGTLQFRGDSLSAKLCNIISGNYSASGSTLRSNGFISTMMYCEGDLMNVESLFDIDGATYSVSGDSLTITTRRGTVLVWKKQ